MTRVNNITLYTAVCLSTLGCGSGNNNEPTTSNDSATAGDAGAEAQELQLYTVTQDPGFADVLHNWNEMYREEHPGTRFVQLEVTRDNYGAYYQDVIAKLNAGKASDVVEATQDAVMFMLTGTEGKLAKIDDVYEDTGLSDAIPAGLKKNMTLNFGGESALYAVPHSLLRGTMLVYNITMLAQHDVDPPANIEEFLAACEKLKADGVTPLAISHESVSLLILLNALAPSIMGTQMYAAWSDGRLGADSSVLSETIDVMTTVLQNYTKDTGVTEFDNGAMPKLLVDGDVAMYFDGMWGAGYLQQQGWEYGVDFDMQEPPGTSDMFQYIISVFAMPSDAPHPETARDFLRFLASPEAEVEGSRILGGVPPRTDVDRSKLTPFVRDNLEDYERATILTMPIVRQEWREAIVQFGADLDKEKLLKAFADAPPIPQ